MSCQRQCYESLATLPHHHGHLNCNAVPARGNE